MLAAWFRLQEAGIGLAKSSKAKAKSKYCLHFPLWAYSFRLSAGSLMPETFYNLFCVFFRLFGLKFKIMLLPLVPLMAFVKQRHKNSNTYYSNY